MYTIFKNRYHSILIFLILASVTLSLAQDAPITISSQVDKARITIGDLIIYSVTVVHDPDVNVEMPGLGVNLGGFEIRDYQEREPAKENGKIISGVDYTISTFFTGEFEIPLLSIQYSMPDDSTKKVLSSEPIKIVVESVKPSEAGDIKDIKPPMEIPRSWKHLLPWILLGLLSLIIFLLIFFAYRRRKTGKGILPTREEPPRPVHEVALEALDALKALNLLEKGEIKLFYIQISEIIRQYIGGRYFMVAMEMTTTEVLRGLENIYMSDDVFQLFRSFFFQCDMVKFAKYIPSDQEHDTIITTAYSIVHQTKIFMEVSVQDEKVNAVEQTENAEAVEVITSSETEMIVNEENTTNEQNDTKGAN